MSADEKEPIIVKKVIKKIDGGHGGAWKVAYADFVTAMMAFFMLLWLLNVATDEAKNLISSYFDPSHPTISSRDSGAGGVLGGLSVSKEGAMATNKQPLAEKQATGKKGQGEAAEKKGVEGYDPGDIEKLQEELAKRQKARFEGAQAQMEQMFKNAPDLEALSKHLKIDITDEGLRIQIIDQEGEPLFASGSSELMPRARTLLLSVGEVIELLPNKLSIRGHTDSSPLSAQNGEYTNWELSADRANASRRVLMSEAIDEARLENIMGKAAQDPLLEDDTENPQNRRITLLLLNEPLEDALARGEFTADTDGTEETIQDGLFDEVDPNVPFTTRPNEDEDEGFKRTPGEFYFP